ncbi:GmrSD restriction endonuclease domain-containing protein, partial [Vibrio parahaemolyticus]
TFGGQPDSIYPAMRDLINDNLGKFPLTETIAHYRGRRKSISFTEDDVESLLDLQYGKAKTYCALTLLYPGLNYTFKYHQDHIHPKSLFTKRKMRKLGFSEEQIDTYLNQVNGLANLQLLHATTNVEKSNKPFEDWLKAEYPNSADRESFLRQHYIGADESLAFEDFLPFIQQRREKLKATLVKMLDVATHHEPEMAEEL